MTTRFELTVNTEDITGKSNSTSTHHFKLGIGPNEDATFRIDQLTTETVKEIMGQYYEGQFIDSESSSYSPLTGNRTYYRTVTPYLSQ